MKPREARRRLAAAAKRESLGRKLDLPSRVAALPGDQSERCFAELEQAPAIGVKRERQFTRQFQPPGGQPPDRLALFHAPARLGKIDAADPGWSSATRYARDQECTRQPDSTDTLPA